MAEYKIHILDEKKVQFIKNLLEGIGLTEEINNKYILQENLDRIENFDEGSLSSIKPENPDHPTH